MSTYDISGWNDFLLAGAGAAAALAGLVFIGISINLAAILRMQGLPGRAGETIVVLAGALVVCLSCLAPGQARSSLGITLLALGGAAWATTVLIQVRSPQRASGTSYQVGRVLLTQLATLPFVVGGVSLLVGAGGGLYWMMAGVISSLLVGLASGWVLLVEILR